MYSYKTILNQDGSILDKCVLFIDNVSQYFEITEEMMVVDIYNDNLIKPTWIDSEWVEGATDEEIQEYNKSHSVMQEDPTDIELLQMELAQNSKEIAKKNYEMEKMKKDIQLLHIKIMEGSD